MEPEQLPLWPSIRWPAVDSEPEPERAGFPTPDASYPTAVGGVLETRRTPAPHPWQRVIDTISARTRDELRAAIRAGLEGLPLLGWSAWARFDAARFTAADVEQAALEAIAEAAEANAGNR